MIKVIYSEKNPILSIVEIEKMSWDKGKFNVSPREYSSLSFRIKGSAEIEANEVQYTANAGDILYLPQGISYTASYTETEMIAIHFLTEHSDEALEVYRGTGDEQLYSLFLKAHTNFKSKGPGYMLHAISHLYGIFATISEKENGHALPAHLKDSLAFIGSNYRNADLKIDDICKSVGIGATALRDTFRQNLKKTPTQYVTELRLEYARGLISSGASVELAAYESGFNDPKYFARTVKKFFGCTPRELRLYGK